MPDHEFDWRKAIAEIKANFGVLGTGIEEIAAGAARDARRDENDAQARQIAALNAALCSLTPGGSEFDMNPTVCAQYAKDSLHNVQGLLKQVIIGRKEADKQIAALREALDRVVGMCGNPTIERCACGRPTGLPAIVAYAGRALSSVPPSSMRLVPLERLREIEHCNIDDEACCPACFGNRTKRHGKIEHAPDCWLGNAIAGKETGG